MSIDDIRIAAALQGLLHRVVKPGIKDSPDGFAGTPADDFGMIACLVDEAIAGQIE